MLQFIARAALSSVFVYAGQAAAREPGGRGKAIKHFLMIVCPPIDPALYQAHIWRCRIEPLQLAQHGPPRIAKLRWGLFLRLSVAARKQCVDALSLLSIR